MRITLAVPAFVMMADDGHDRIWEGDVAQDARADFGMHRDFRKLSLRQLAGFIQDVIRHGEFADVMEQRRRLERFKKCFFDDPHLARDFERGDLHAPHMSA